MSTSEFREPTTEELWTQPPAAAVPGGLAVPLQPSPTPDQVAVPDQPAALPDQPAAATTDRTPFALAIVSLALAVPLTAIGAATGGLIGLIIVWIAIVAMNYIYAWTRRR